MLKNDQLKNDQPKNNQSRIKRPQNNQLISLTFLCALLLSCTPAGSNLPGYGSPTGNFVSGARDEAGLLGVNSLLILPLAFDENVRGQSANAPLYYDALVSAFRGDVDFDLTADVHLLSEKDISGASQCHSSGVEAGRRYGVHAVLCTVLHRFTERAGSSMGTERPAALSFSMEMRRVGDGKIIWGGDFVFRDAALNENLFNLSQHLSERGSGGGWQSALSMLERGFREASSDFSRKRLEKFAPGQF